MEFPNIRTEQLLLRQFGEGDLEQVFKGLSHPEVIRYYGVSYGTLESTGAQLQFFRDLETEGRGRWWALCSVDGAQFYGGCGLNNLYAEHRRAEIGFWLLKEHWGKGIMKEAVPAVLHHAFTEMKLHRVEALVETENANSRKLLQKLGFTHEGTMKDYEIKNGSFISLDIFAKMEE